MNSVGEEVECRTATLDDILDIQTVVTPAWRAVYGPILSSEQVEFMLEEFYNTAALTDLIGKHKQEFVMLYENKVAKGFAAFSVREENPEVYKLNKLYLLPECKGKGFGRILMDEVEERVRLKSGKTVELNVNKYNDSQHFYHKMGYEIAYEEDIPIGQYWMNDYVMRKHLFKPLSV